MNDYRAYVETDYNAIYHHGIKGQRWGVRNGPPYPLDAEDHSTREIVAANNPSKYTYKRKRTNHEARYSKYLESRDKGFTAKNVARGDIKKTNPLLAKVGGALSKGASGLSKGLHERRIKRYMKQGMSRKEAEQASRRSEEQTKRGLRNAMLAGAAVATGFAAYKIGRHWFQRNKDVTIRAGRSMDTLSYDVNRMKTAKEGKDFASSQFFTNPDKSDLYFYETFFNKSAKVGNRNVLKYKSSNIALRDIKVASEKTGEDVFLKMYRNNKGFREYVTNPDLMSSTMPPAQRNMRGYKDALKTLNKVRARDNQTASEKEIRKLYKLYNYHLGAGQGTQGLLGRSTTKEAAEAYVNSKKGNGFKYRIDDLGNGQYSVVNETLTDDINNYKNIFYGDLKNRGYGAVLDVNDAMYGRFKANYPVIVFDNSAWVTRSNMRVRPREKQFATAYTLGRKAMPYVAPMAAAGAAYTATVGPRDQRRQIDQNERSSMTSQARSLYNSGRSQEEIARRLGVSVSTVNNLLNG